MFGWLKKKTAKQEAEPKPGSREYARDILAEAYEAYRLARRDRPREHYQPHGYSGDSAITGSNDLMNRRTRDLVRNAAQAKIVVNSLEDLIVGTGVQTYSWPFAPSELFEIVTELESLQAGELGPRLTFALESDDLFDQWFNDPTEFDAEGRMSGPEMQRMALKEAATVGTGLMIRTFRKDYSLVPLAYQIVEQEQLDRTMDRPASEGKNKIVDGREFDKSNRLVGIHLYLDHPHDLFGSVQSSLRGAGASLSVGSRRQFLPASRVIDLSLPHRPSASGGATWLDACGQSIWDRDQYIGDEMRSAALDAVFAFAAYLEDGDKNQPLGFDDGACDSDAAGNRQFKLGHSPVGIQMKTTERLEMVRSARPNKDAPPFIKMLDRDTARAAGLSYYTATGDYEATTFTSTKGAKQDEDLHIRPLQNWVATHAALPIRKHFNEIAAASGLFESLSPAEFRRNIGTYQRFDAIGNGRDLIDPYKEGEARTTRLRTCMSTFKEECARNGKHWIRVLMQIAVERRVADLFNVPLDFAGTAAGPAKAKADDDDEAQDDEDAEQTKETTRAA